MKRNAESRKTLEKVLGCKTTSVFTSKVKTPSSLQEESHEMWFVSSNRFEMGLRGCLQNSPDRQFGGHLRVPILHLIKQLLTEKGPRYCQDRTAPECCK